MSDNLQNKNTDVAIKELLHQLLPDHQVSCTINLEGRKLASKAKSHLYFIIKEAIMNIKRHAQAKRAEVRLELVDETIHLFIQDDGCGFSLALIPKDPEGLIDMPSRVLRLRGTYELDANPRQGVAH